MIVLGLETSCDETGLAIYDSEQGLRGQVLYSQIQLHAEYGGVVPELASRDHVRKLIPLLDQLLSQCDLSKQELDAIAYTRGPGLMGALMTGALFGRSLAFALNKPAIGVHHMEGHLLAPLLSAQPPQFPFVALLVSGGHTQLMAAHALGEYELLGESIDDAAGEAFDKVAKIIGLPYPGGPSISQAALEGNPFKYKLPKAKTQNPYDYSFSGLKTAVLRAVQAECGKPFDFPSHGLGELLTPSQRNDFAASFQQVAIETLIDKAQAAFEAYQPQSVVIAGGVAANQLLRQQLKERLPIEIEYAPMSLCTDNAAMIATLGYFMAQKLQPNSPYDFEVVPSLSMTKTAWGK